MHYSLSLHETHVRLALQCTHDQQKKANRMTQIGLKENVPSMAFTIF